MNHQANKDQLNFSIIPPPQKTFILKTILYDILEVIRQKFSIFNGDDDSV